MEIDWVVLRCSLPPRPFHTGSLPPGARRLREGVRQRPGRNGVGEGEILRWRWGEKPGGMEEPDYQACALCALDIPFAPKP